MKKKKFEFSKFITMLIIVIFAAYGVWSGIEYYRLARIAIENNSMMPDTTLAVTCVTTLLGAVLAYCLYQWGLKNSRNKYGIDSEGQPFKEKTCYIEDEENDFPEQDNFNDVDSDQGAEGEDS